MSIKKTLPVKKQTDLGGPKTTTHDRQSPNDYVIALRKKYHDSTADVSMLIHWDRQDHKNEKKPG